MSSEMTLHKNGKNVKISRFRPKDIPDQSEKVVIITGANSGLGYEAAMRLTERNATIIMACRNMKKAERARDSIIENSDKGNLQLMQLDLADFNSIEHFATKFKEKYDRLDVLVNNAGIMETPRMETKQGHELQFGVNHLGHFKLTSHLMNMLLETPESRVLNQSSVYHQLGNIRFDDINWEKKYSRAGAYAQSKLANILFSYELARKVEGKGVRSIAVHPGYARTELTKNGPNEGGKSLWSYIYMLGDRTIAQGRMMGTLPLLYAVTMNDVYNGDYIGPRFWARGSPRRARSNRKSYSNEYARKLWEISEKMVGKKFEIGS